MKGSIFKRIGTHSGTFHCDEALAVFMLRKIAPAASVVRSRDPEVWKTCDILVDVGGEYDHDACKYDHHQRGFEEEMAPFSTKLSSAGLVYKHYGEQVLRTMLPQVGEDELKLIFNRVYEQFVEGVDAIDNGMKRYPGVDVKAAISGKN